MSISVRAMVFGCLVAGTTLLTSCSSQTPEPVGSATSSVPSQQTSIVMSLQSSDTEPQSYEITCSGSEPKGNHPNLEGACEVLLNADIQLFSSGDEEACTDIYGGDNMALMVGHIKGRGISTEFSRVNGCEIARWDALVPLLPQANDEIMEYQAPGSETE